LLFFFALSARHLSLDWDLNLPEHLDRCLQTLWVIELSKAKPARLLISICRTNPSSQTARRLQNALNAIITTSALRDSTDKKCSHDLIPSRRLGHHRVTTMVALPFAGGTKTSTTSRAL
jgi:hypothetical protein